MNEYGSFETQIPLLSSAQTGSYVANVFTSNNVLIGSKVIKVEEFMPDRIKLEVNLDKKEYKPGEKILVDIEAVNFFGPPAANRNYEVELSIKQAGFYPTKNRDYNYHIRGTHSSFRNILRQDKTGEEGKAHEEFDIPREYKNMGMLKADLFSTVFDETGRPVNRLNRLTIYTQVVFFGVKCEDYYVKTGMPVRYKLIAVDKNGNELNDVDAQIELIRHEYKTVLSRSGGYFRYKSEKVEKVLKKKTIKINAKSTVFSFTPDVSGNYELRISAPGVNTYVERDIYAYGWGSTRYSSFKVNNEGQIDIELDKEKYNIGEKANVILKTPFTGRVLVTIETDKVVDYFYLETDKRAASFSLDIKEEYLPGVYIGATLFRPHEESDIPLTVAHGYAPIKVDDPDNKMPVSITAVEKSRSNSKQIIKIKSKPNSALTVAVVDEGILQVAGYETPDPYDFFYQRRALQVSSSNVYPYLFPEVGMVRSHTGGDGSEMEKRLNPMQNNRVKLVSFWSGIIETNSRGEAEYEIDIPQFSGDLRIMAIAYNGKGFGSEQKNMKVADPLVISVALPRFLSPGDQVNVPVILTNTTNKQTNCRTTLKLEGPVNVIGESTGTVSIPPNTEAEVMYRVEAQQQLGESSVVIEANALGEKFSNKTDITVRPASPLQKRTGTGWVDAGKTATIKINIDDFIKSSVDGYLIISKNPMIQYSQSLDYLVRYPYGCVEQTVSSAFPQLYFGDLVGAVFSDEKALKDAVGNVQKALDRIKLMQLYNGGLTYWPGHGTETWWGSVFAAHFTLEAKKAGYEVDESFLRYLLKYLKKKLEKKETITYYYNSNRRKKIAPKEVAYSLYVLALAGEKPTALLNYYHSRTEQLSLDSKYLLAGAYALTGNVQKASEVLPEAFEGEKAVTSFGGSFYSYIRDEAIALNVLLEIDPDNQQVGRMVKHISEILKNKRYLNTQERTFGFLAMGKFARSLADTDPKGVLKANGKVIGAFENKELKVNAADIASKTVELTTEGTGKLYYFWESEGISRDGSYLEEDKYIKVRRNFYNRNGILVSSNQFKQNDLVLVEIALTGLTNQYVENVAITDILPACFEIENPRLTTLPPGMNYPNTRSHPQYIDIRDDRINMFSYARSRTYYYYYLVRVVSTGTYKMGPVSADAMYNGEYHSYHGAGTIVVKRK
ncbi:Alpha-2-macroglobulin [subsurface metagenome]